MTTPYYQIGVTAPKDMELATCNSCGRVFNDWSDAKPCPYCKSTDIERPEIDKSIKYTKETENGK
jgi:rubrerythrin